MECDSYILHSKAQVVVERRAGSGRGPQQVELLGSSARRVVFDLICGPIRIDQFDGARLQEEGMKS